MVPLTRLLFLCIQMGYVTVDNILLQLKRIAVQVTTTAATNCLKTMVDAGLLSGEVRQSEGGAPEEAFKIHKNCSIAFSGVEMDHILILEPILDKDKATQALKNAFGDRTKLYKDWCRFWIRLRNVTPFFGAYSLETSNPQMQMAYSKSPYKCEGLRPEGTLMLARADRGGAILIHRAIPRNWLVELLQMENAMPAHETLRERIHASNIYLVPQKGKELSYVTLPIVGVGLVTYEVIAAGQVFEARIDIPTSTISPERLTTLIVEKAGVSARSLSPGRGSQTGDVEVLYVDGQPFMPVQGDRPITRYYEAPASVLRGEIPGYMLGELEDPFGKNEE